MKHATYDFNQNQTLTQILSKSRITTPTSFYESSCSPRC